MGDDRRWAARYQFLAELWRGRDRIVCDRELEAALHQGLGGGIGGAVEELLTSLVPSDGGGGGRAWVALRNDRRAASFARSHSGTVFVAVDEAAEIASDQPWKVALVHLDRADARARAELLDAELEAFLEILGEQVEDDPGRSVVLSLACGADEDLGYELLAELVEELFGDGRIYGLARPAMAAFYDFGPVLEPAPGDDGGDGEAGIEVDNTLGSEQPRCELFVAVIGAALPGDGVTFVELPGAASGASELRGTAGSGDDELGALRVQLAEAQRRGDLQAIERQALLEKLEQAEDRIASLEEQLEFADDEPPEDVAAPESGPRLDELLAREQTLRWELERSRGELERLEARPVEALEAEVASLRAQLERAQARIEALEAEAEDEDETDAEETGEADLADLAALLDELDEPTPAQAREWRRARSKLEHLLRKLERGGRLSALELHRELALLRRLL